MEVSCGSGFIISGDGHILTNAHVVQDHIHGARGVHLHDDTTATHLEVALSTGETYPAKVVAADSVTDIAVIQIHADRPLPIAKIGDSEKVRAGEFVVAVGSPLALSNSCSFGIISCIHRDLDIAGEDSVGLKYLQTDLAINAGSSGGPLVSLDGEVVGVCSKKIAGGVEGIGFAIPITYAQNVVAELSDHGSLRRPFLGLALISLSLDVLKDLKREKNYRIPLWLETEVQQGNGSMPIGLMVHDITRGGPGDRAGLRPGDVIVSVDEVPTRTTSEFLAAMIFKVHRKVCIGVRRAESGKVEVMTVEPEVLQDLSKRH